MKVSNVPKVTQLVNSGASICPKPDWCHSSQPPKLGGQGWEPMSLRYTIRNHTTALLKKLEYEKNGTGFPNPQHMLHSSGKVRHYHQHLSHSNWTLGIPTIVPGLWEGGPESSLGAVWFLTGNGRKPTRFDSQKGTRPHSSTHSAARPSVPVKVAGVGGHSGTNLSADSYFQEGKCVA